MAVSSDGARAYVANLLDDSVSVIESRRRKVVSTIDVGSRPCRVALSPDGKRIYVDHADGISVVSL